MSAYEGSKMQERDEDRKQSGLSAGISGDIFGEAPISTPTQLTTGQRAAGVSFNPSKDPFVDEIKQLYADIIDKLDKARNEAGRGEKGRYYSKAISYTEDAQVNAVKAITWQY